MRVSVLRVKGFGTLWVKPAPGVDQEKWLKFNKGEFTVMEARVCHESFSESYPKVTTMMNRPYIQLFGGLDLELGLSTGSPKKT